MSHATVNVAYPLRQLIADGSEDLYPRARLYDQDDTLLATVPLVHVAEGMYGADYTFTDEGHVFVIVTVYTDAGFTTPGDYDKEADEIEVTATIPAAILDALLEDHLVADSVGESLTLMRGLLQQNFVLDQPVYNAAGLLTSSRIRIFPTAADATAGTNAIATYVTTSVAQAAPNTGRPASYKVTRTA